MAALEGQVAIVTGASRGIGRAIALELAHAGARVALNYLRGEAAARVVAAEIAALRGARLSPADRPSSQATAREVAAETSTMLVQADVADPAQARAMIEQVVNQWGRIDVLVNNAGITRDRTLRRMSDDDWVAVINNNLNSVFYCTSAAIPAMIKQGGGRIINISSLIAQSGNIGQANYAAAKGGIISFTKTAALELARHNITVNAIAPGFTETDMFSNVSAEIQDQIKARIPLARFARPEEVAKVVTFLAVDGAYITGQQLNINGGLYM